LFIVITNKDFHNAVAAMPGYNISEMGKLVAEL